jgi:hypothetical protein
VDRGCRRRTDDCVFVNSDASEKQIERCNNFVTLLKSRANRSANGTAWNGGDILHFYDVTLSQSLDGWMETRPTGVCVGEDERCNNHSVKRPNPVML